MGGGARGHLVSYFDRAPLQVLPKLSPGMESTSPKKATVAEQHYTKQRATRALRRQCLYNVKRTDGVAEKLSLSSVLISLVTRDGIRLKSHCPTACARCSVFQERTIVFHSCTFFFFFFFSGVLQITEDKLRGQFSEKGHVTDCSLKYTKDGIFRRFAFIGYKNLEEANAAVKHFDRSYINTSKITVFFKPNAMKLGRPYGVMYVSSSRTPLWGDPQLDRGLGFSPVGGGCVEGGGAAVKGEVSPVRGVSRSDILT